MGLNLLETEPGKKDNFTENFTIKMKFKNRDGFDSDGKKGNLATSSILLSTFQNENILYRPHTITALIGLVSYLLYLAFYCPTSANPTLQ